MGGPVKQAEFALLPVLEYKYIHLGRTRELINEIALMVVDFDHSAGQ